MKLVGVHHVSFTVSELERSVAFYETLGFELERRHVVSDAAGVGGQLSMAFLLGAGIRLELLEYERALDPEPPREGDVGGAHLCLQVDDLDEWYEQLRGQGATFLSAPNHHQGLGAKWVFLVDPDEIRIELFEPVSL